MDSNFLHTLTPRQQRSLMRWYHISVGLFIALFALVFFVELQQLITLRAAHNEHTALTHNHKQTTQLLDQVTTLKHQENNLKRHLETVATIKMEQRKINDVIKTLTDLIPHGYALESVVIAHNTIELLVACPHIKEATNLIALLEKNSHLQQVTLHTLQQSHGTHHALLATVRATLA